MAITLHTKPQGAATYTFNESRLARIVKAKTLEEAQKMGLFDRIFHGQSKKAAIAQLYASITGPSPHESKPASVLTRFNRLRDLANDEQRGQFNTEVGPPDAKGCWNFSLSIGEATLYASPDDMRDEPHTSYEEFMGTLKADQFLVQTERLAKAIGHDSPAVLQGRTQASYAQGALQFASDDGEVRQQLKEHLDDPLFCSSNFRGVEPGDDPATFKANFESPGGERKQWVLSNRAATEGEFRGERLQQALARGSYNNLGELFGADFEGPSDRHIRGLVIFKLREFKEAINSVTGADSSPEDLLDDMLRLQKTDPETAGKIFNTLCETQLGRTRLVDVLFGGRLRSEMSAGVEGLVAQLAQPDADASDVLLAAAQLGDSVRLLVGNDPAADKGTALIAPMCDEQAQKMSDEQLRQAFQTFTSQPVLIRPYEAVFAKTREFIDLQEGHETEEQVNAVMYRAQPLLYASAMLETQFKSVLAESNARGLLDAQWLDPAHLENTLSAAMAPQLVGRFLDLCVIEGQALKLAAQQAKESASPSFLTEYALKV